MTLSVGSYFGRWDSARQRTNRPLEWVGPQSAVEELMAAFDRKAVPTSLLGCPIIIDENAIELSLRVATDTA